MIIIIFSAADMLLNGLCVQLCMLFICDVVPLFPTAPLIIASGLLFGPKVRNLFREIIQKSCQKAVSKKSHRKETPTPSHLHSTFLIAG